MTRAKSPIVATLTLAALPGFAGSSFAGEVEIDASRSIIAVVTHKGGVAASQAHNHLAVAADYRVRLTFDPERPLAAGFELELASEDLEIDDWTIQQAWYPRLEKLGILDEPFSELADKTRAKIRAAMLGDGQLDSAAFPTLAARVAGISEEPSTVAGVELPYAVTLALEVRGETVEKKAAARYELTDDRLTIEAVGAFRFTDFGIKPYSAAFGLVKNLDEFHLYLHLEGRLPDGRPPTD
ncbi:MAG: hypothetical protein V3T72_14170 [Thermoanaerobaculia bacterium]